LSGIGAAPVAEILNDNRSGHDEGIDLTEGMLERARSMARNTGRDNFRLCAGHAYVVEPDAAALDPDRTKKRARTHASAGPSLDSTLMKTLAHQASDNTASIVRFTQSDFSNSTCRRR